MTVPSVSSRHEFRFVGGAFVSGVNAASALLATPVTSNNPAPIAANFFAFRFPVSIAISFVCLQHTAQLSNPLRSLVRRSPLLATGCPSPPAPARAGQCSGQDRPGSRRLAVGRGRKGRARSISGLRAPRASGLPGPVARSASLHSTDHLSLHRSTIRSSTGGSHNDDSVPGVSPMPANNFIVNYNLVTWLDQRNSKRLFGGFLDTVAATGS